MTALPWHTPCGGAKHGAGRAGQAWTTRGGSMVKTSRDGAKTAERVARRGCAGFWERYSNDIPTSLSISRILMTCCRPAWDLTGDRADRFNHRCGGRGHRYSRRLARAQAQQATELGAILDRLERPGSRNRGAHVPLYYGFLPTVVLDSLFEPRVDRDFCPLIRRRARRDDSELISSARSRRTSCWPRSSVSLRRTAGLVSGDSTATSCTRLATLMVVAGLVTSYYRRLSVHAKLRADLRSTAPNRRCSLSGSPVSDERWPESRGRWPYLTGEALRAALPSFS